MGSARMDFPLRGRTQVDNGLIVTNDTGAPALGSQPLIKGSGRCFLPWMSVLFKLFDAIPSTVRGQPPHLGGARPYCFFLKEEFSRGVILFWGLSLGQTSPVHSLPPGLGK